MGSIQGSVLGAVVVGAVYFLTSQFQYLSQLVFGGLLVLLIILRPQGILPSAQRKLELEVEETPTGIPPHSESVPA
jgi:branched-chain amino acid transport system permease protein